MASSETGCPLANIVFDLRDHNEETRKRLLSAADFVLRYAFDNLHANPLTVTKSPIVYIFFGKASFASFVAAKLLALNMLHLEDAITKYCSVGDLHQMSDEEINTIVRKVLTQKEEKNKQDKEPTYPKGTGMSDNIILDVMIEKLHSFESKHDHRYSPKNTCRICAETLIRCTVYTLPYCEHEFHTRCVKRRVAENTLCPICQNWALPIQAEYPNWINDCEKVREFLTRDSSASFLSQRYITSLSVFHALMAVHLDELKLRDVLQSFGKQVYTIMVHEKETRIEENDMIRKEVVEFLKDCRYIEKGLVERFNSFMEMMFSALCLDHVHQIEFRKRMREVNVHQLKDMESIRKLSRLVQAVAYVQAEE